MDFNSVKKVGDYANLYSVLLVNTQYSRLFIQPRLSPYQYIRRLSDALILFLMPLHIG